MPVGSCNKNFVYTLGGRALEDVRIRSNLRILISDFKFSKQWAKLASGWIEPFALL